MPLRTIYLLVVLFPIITTAQTTLQGYSRRDITIDNGLPQNTVYAINRDKNGFFWIVTNYGIVRWNGININTPIVESAYPQSIVNDLRVPTFYNGNLCFRVADVPWHYVDSNSRLKKLDIPEESIVNMAGAFSGDIVMLNAGQIEQIKKQNDKTTAESFINDFVGNQAIRSAAWKMPGGEIYLLSEDSLFYCSNHKVKYLTRLPYRGYPIKAKNDLFVIDTSGLVTVFNKGNVLRRYYESKLKVDNTYSKYMWYIQYAGDTVYIGLQNKVMRLTATDNDALDVQKAFILDDWRFLSSFFVNERSAEIILGTDNAGCRFYQQPKIFTHIISPVPERNASYSLIWQNDRIVTNQELFNKVYKKNVDWVWGLIGDIVQLPAGNILCGANKAILLLNNKLEVLKSWKTNESVVADIYITDSIIYYNTGRLGKIDIRSNVVLRADEFWPGLTDVSCFTESRNAKSRIYAIQNNQLILADLAKKEKKVLDETKIPSPRSIFFDEELNVLLITTRGGGMYLSDTSGGIIQLPVSGHNALLSAHYFIKDRDGDFWVPTNSGLYFFRKKELIDFITHRKPNIDYFRFGRYDGIKNEEFNGGFGSCYAYNGKNYFLATMDGVVEFNPEIKKTLVTPGAKIVLDKIIVDQVSVANTADIQLSPYFKELVVYPDAAFFSWPGSRIQYRLLGSRDPTWNFVEVGKPISIKYLASGKYTLQIKINSLLADDTLNLPFVVKPFWYATWWFYSLLAILIIAAFLVSLRWRSLVLKRQADIQINRNREQLFSIISHDLKSPLNNYLGLTDTLNYLIRNNDFERLQLIGGEMDKAGKKLTLLLNNLFNWSIDQQELLQSHKKKIIFSELLHEALSLYQGMIDQKELVIKLSNSVSAPVHADRNLLFLVMRNTFDNAIKSAMIRSEINVQCHIGEESLHFAVSNDFDAVMDEKIDQICEAFNSAKALHPGVNGFGFGIVMIRIAVKKMSGKAVMRKSDDLVTMNVMIPVK